MKEREALYRRGDLVLTLHPPSSVRFGSLPTVVTRHVERGDIFACGSRG